MASAHHHGSPDGDDPAWTVRDSTRKEYPAFAAVFAEAIGMPVELLLDGERDFPSAEYDRSLVALDGERIVGTTTAYSLTLTVPGGPRRAAGITDVGVWPTHRRRGVLSALMRRQLADLRARGEKLAVLWSSEGGIYGRFGYGPAIRQFHATVPRAHAVLRPDAPRDPALTVELTDPGAVREEIEELHRRTAPLRNGQILRKPGWWGRLLHDAERDRRGAGPLRAALVRGPDRAEGYALYRVLHKWENGLPEGEVRAVEVVSATPAARVALYEHVFSRDLATEASLEHLAEDDPLTVLLANPRHLVRTGFDSLWVRLVDLPGALAERSYATPLDTVLEVTDRYAPWNAGRWRLRADGEGARAEATDEAPDLALDVSHLGAAHLGRGSLTGLVDAGLATEHTPGAAARLDTAMHVPRAPLCGTSF
ncbi:GNAT family N-acetyltransferase [Nocardiopsis sp. NPDC058631]|uniref:GNAT family N-acetyltransferase n=1 Tax=Nocardiopsis sp. NPDC058631 TaxID=3346566 RepID=UPI003669B29B